MVSFKKECLCENGHLVLCHWKSKQVLRRCECWTESTPAGSSTSIKLACSSFDGKEVTVETLNTPEQTRAPSASKECYRRSFLPANISLYNCSLWIPNHRFITAQCLIYFFFFVFKYQQKASGQREESNYTRWTTNTDILWCLIVCPSFSI